MRKLNSFVCSLSLVFSVTLFMQARASAEEFKPKTIYGDDNRKDLFEVQDPLYLNLADSTVALVPHKKFTKINSKGVAMTNGYSLAFLMDVCAEERFSEQDTIAYCSGFLVGEDLIATAGHCVEDQFDCDETAFVFGFGIKDQNGSSPKTIPLKDIYSCKKIIASSRSYSSDFAVIQLDRKVTDRKALNINRTGLLNVNTPLVLIGHPSGLPTKVADGAQVASVQKYYNSFKTNLDAYGGNSGSAVFNAVTGEVEGILVRGNADYILKGECKVSIRCEASECTGETAMLASILSPYVP